LTRAKRTGASAVVVLCGLKCDPAKVKPILLTCFTTSGTGYNANPGPAQDEPGVDDCGEHNNEKVSYLAIEGSPDNDGKLFYFTQATCFDNYRNGAST
jgi:hypothetical protein